MELALTVTMIGLSGSGKTSIIHSLINNQNEIFPTAGFEINYITSQSKLILAYDCSGQSYTRSNWNKLSVLADCIVYVIDMADSAKFALAKKYLMSFLQNNRFMKSKNLCIMLNKVDVKDRPSKELLYKALETEKIQKLISRLYVKETSAFNKEGLDQCLDWIVKNNQTTSA